LVANMVVARWPRLWENPNVGRVGVRAGGIGAGQ
jgi:hypothetical protein